MRTGVRTAMRTGVRTVQRKRVRGGEGLLKIQEAPRPPRARTARVVR